MTQTGTRRRERPRARPPATRKRNGTRLLRRRPAETAAAGLGSAVGAVFVILSAYGVNVPAAVPGAALILVSWVATVVTANRKESTE